MAATAAAPASTTPATTTMPISWQYYNNTNYNNSNVPLNHGPRWNFAISQLLNEMQKYESVIEKFSDNAPGNYVQFLVQPEDENRLLQFILTRLPSLANPNRITVSSTPMGNRCISISVSGEAPTFFYTQRPQAVPYIPAASGATKTST